MFQVDGRLLFLIMMGETAGNPAFKEVVLPDLFEGWGEISSVFPVRKQCWLKNCINKESS